MAKVLVTGGAGFIGSHIADYLLEKGHDITILDDLSTGSEQNIRHILDRVKFIRGSICDPETLDRAMDGAEYVLHQAALPSVPRSISDPLTTNRVNVEGTLLVLLAARRCGVRRVVFASSSSIYGNAGDLPRRETDAPQPLSPYAVAKLAAENYCRAFCNVFQLETVSLRYFNVFGPRQKPHSNYAAVIPSFIMALLHGKPPVIYGDGENSRDFTFVENVARAALLAMEKPGIAGEVFNIACGCRTNLKQLAEMLNKIVGTNIAPIFSDPRPGDVRHSQADISKAKQLLGYQPTVSLEEGLRRTVDWFKGKVEAGSSATLKDW